MYLVFLQEKKERMALSTRLRGRRHTRSSNSLVSSKAHDMVLRLEKKNKKEKAGI